MVLDLAKLKRKGKTEESFFFEYFAEDLDLTLPDAELVLPIKIEGQVSLTGERSAVLEGEACYAISGSCTRCLSPTEKTFTVEFSELCDEDADGVYKVKNDKIDLAPIIDELITLNTPVSFLCKEDCKGICPSCGVNLNEGDCKCIKDGK